MDRTLPLRTPTTLSTRLVHLEGDQPTPHLRVRVQHPRTFPYFFRATWPAHCHFNMDITSIYSSFIINFFNLFSFILYHHHHHPNLYTAHCWAQVLLGMRESLAHCSHADPVRSILVCYIYDEAILVYTTCLGLI